MAEQAEQAEQAVKELHWRTLRLVLDRTQVYAEDPGQGTPAMVYLGPYCATYWCAVGEGELYAWKQDGVYQLSPAQLAWLERQADTVNEFLYPPQGERS